MSSLNNFKLFRTQFEWSFLRRDWKFRSSEISSGKRKMLRLHLKNNASKKAKGISQEGKVRNL